MKLLKLSNILFLLSACFVLLCSGGPTTVMNDRGGSEVVGVIVNVNSDVAQNIPVFVYKNSEVSRIDSVNLVIIDPPYIAIDTTNYKGEYSFENLDTGVYNLKAVRSTDSATAFIKNVHVAYFAPSTQPAYKVNNNLDTLTLPGKISGTVLLPGNPTKPVICYIPGTSYAAFPQPNTKFTITGIPAGTYTILYSYLGDGYENAVDSNVVVKSKATKTLPPKTLQLSKVGPPPTPINLKAVYDTLLGQVTLSWNKVQVSDLKNYVVYIKSDTGWVVAQTVTDTIFTDKISFADSNHFTVSYVVKSQDSSLFLSTNFSEPVEVPVISPSLLRTDISLLVNNKSTDTISVNDKVLFVAKYSNQTSSVTKLQWWINSKDSTLKNTHVSLQNGYDTLSISWKQAGTRLVHFSATDTTGKLWTDSISVVVVNIPPKIIFITPDTSIEFGGTVSCSLAVSHPYGGLCTLSVDINGDKKYDMIRKGYSLDTSFSTGVSATWNGVRIRIADRNGNVIDTGFSVTINKAPLHDHWESFDSLKTSRKLFCADTLGGKIFAMGGCIQSTKLTIYNSVEIYDTATKKWSAGSPMLNARYGFISCNYNNKLYVLTGRRSKVFAKVIEEYNPANSTWTQYDSIPSFSREGCASCLIGNTLYLFGGITSSFEGDDSTTSGIYSYNLATKTLKHVGDMQKSRSYLHAVVIKKQVYLLGGKDEYEDPISETELFDPQTGLTVFDNSLGLPDPASNFAAINLNDTLFVIGGITSNIVGTVSNTVESYNFETRMWIPKEPLLANRHSMAITSIDGKIIILGGETDLLNRDQSIGKSVLKYYP